MKGLEELKRLAYEIACCRCQYYIDNKCTNKGECVWKIIEQELKALEIIKSKELNIHALLLHLKRFDSPSGYNVLVGNKYKITQEEYDLLKEVLL